MGDAVKCGLRIIRGGECFFSPFVRWRSFCRYASPNPLHQRRLSQPTASYAKSKQPPSLGTSSEFSQSQRSYRRSHWTHRCICCARSYRPLLLDGRAYCWQCARPNGSQAGGTEYIRKKPAYEFGSTTQRLATLDAARKNSSAGAMIRGKHINRSDPDLSGFLHRINHQRTLLSPAGPRLRFAVTTGNCGHQRQNAPTCDAWGVVWPSSGLDVYPLIAKFPRSVFLNRDSFPFTEISRIIAEYKVAWGVLPPGLVQ
jgi:hypothetical protein